MKTMANNRPGVSKTEGEDCPVDEVLALADHLLKSSIQEEKPVESDQMERLAGLIANLEGAVTCHQGHMPEIELIDADHAKGIWAMTDRVDHPDYLLVGHGHYHEEYVRQNGRWKIRRLKLTRLHEERTLKN